MTTPSQPYIKVGDKLFNNDPRVGDYLATVTVTEINVVAREAIGASPARYGVAYRTAKRRVTIAYSRIYVDRKPRHQGYNWIG